MAESVNISLSVTDFHRIVDALYDYERELRSLADRCYIYTTPAKRKQMYDDAWEAIQLRSRLLAQLKD